MSKFYYFAKSHAGKDETGILEAKDEQDLARILREKNLILVSSKILEEEKIRKNPLINGLKGILNRISLVEKLMFTRNLAVVVSAGFSLHRGLEMLVKQTENSGFKRIIADLVERIKRGEAFADSLTVHHKVFDNFFVSMVRVGEKGGTLEEVLKILSQHLKKEHEFRSKVIGAMVYPAVILVAMAGVGILMMLVVMPKLTAMFEELNVNLPITTQILIIVSKFLSKYSYIGAIILLGAIIALIKSVRTQKGKQVISWITIKIPFFNKIVKKINCARFARSFYSLMKSGVSIVESLNISAQTLGNFFYSKALVDIGTGVKEGKKLQELLEKYNDLFPVLVGQMVGVGEETGELSEIMEKLADFYEEEVTNITDNLTSIIEPVLMIVLGAIVAFFAISMIQPMYSMMEGL